MENLSPHEQLLSNVLKKMSTQIDVPPINTLRARTFVEQLAPPQQQRQDVISFVASFLNMRVKLYHVVIVFVCAWLCYLYFQQRPAPVKFETASSSASNTLASTNNSTVLPCIQTYCLKK